MSDTTEVLLGVMDIQDAKNHQIRLKESGVLVDIRTNGKTCTTGCKVTVELWAQVQDEGKLKEYFRADYLKHVKGHEPNVEHLSQVFDPSMAEVICQACGAKFAPTASECPDCGLCY